MEGNPLHKIGMGVCFLTSYTISAFVLLSPGSIFKLHHGSFPFSKYIITYNNKKENSKIYLFICININRIKLDLNELR